MESNREALAIFKLPTSAFAGFERELRGLHPYDIPEIIALSIDRGLPEYMRWVMDSCPNE